METDTTTPKKAPQRLPLKTIPRRTPIYLGESAGGGMVLLEIEIYDDEGEAESLHPSAQLAMALTERCRMMDLEPVQKLGTFYYFGHAFIDQYADDESSTMVEKSRLVPDLFYVNAEEDMNIHRHWEDKKRELGYSRGRENSRRSWWKLTHAERYYHLDARDLLQFDIIVGLPIRVSSRDRFSTKNPLSINSDATSSVSIHLDPRPHVGFTVEMVGASARFKCLRYTSGDHAPRSEVYFRSELPKKFFQHGIDGLVRRVNELHSEGSDWALVSLRDVKAVDDFCYAEVEKEVLRAMEEQEEKEHVKGCEDFPDVKW